MRQPTTFVLASLLVLCACSDDSSSDTTTSAASTSSGPTGGAGGSGGAMDGGGGSGGTGATGGGGSGGGVCALGTSWAVIDDFTDGGLGPAQAGSVAADAAGHLYVAGMAGAQGMERWIIRKSSDGGTSWVTVLDVPQGNGGGMAFDGDVIYAAGSQTESGYAHRVVRRSSDGGVSWEILDDFVYESGFDSYSGSVVLDAAGNIYVLGQGDSSTGVHTVLRKSDDGGATWTTTLDQQLAPNKVCVPRGLATTPGGDVFVGTRCVDAGDVPHWLVLRGPLGEQWTVVDDLANAQGWNIFVADAVYTTGTQNITEPHWLVRRADLGDQAFTTIHDLADARALTVYRDGAGALTITGSAGTPPTPQVTTRRSDDDGASWQQIDEWVYGAGVYAGNTHADAEGNLFQSGTGFDPQGVTHGLVRKMACAAR
jgi:hypothetical protein